MRSTVRHRFFYATQQLAPRTQGYPLEEINDYLRAEPHKADDIWRTLSYFDLQHCAPKVQAQTLLVTGNDKDFF